VKKLLLMGLFLAGPPLGGLGSATAQTTTCMSFSWGTTCQSFGGPDYSTPALPVQAPVDYYTPAIIQLEMALAIAPAPVATVKHAIDIVIITRCGRYKSMRATYSDGSTKSIDMKNRFVDEAELEAAEAANPVVRVVDFAECE
jgi:hypothetical protein